MLSSTTYSIIPTYESPVTAGSRHSLLTGKRSFSLQLGRDIHIRLTRAGSHHPPAL